jgi:hypothetical protein
MFMAMKRKVLELGGYERESPRHPNSRPWRMR